MKITYLGYVVLLVGYLAANISAEAEERYPLDKPLWSLSGKEISLENFAGRAAVKIRSGKALLNGVTLQDGLIEFDMYLSGERAFAYLYFRGQSAEQFEEIYFRSHKNNAPDALQYAPVFQRRSAWQLYHGDSGTASVALPANQWIAVKVELKGTTMKVWVGDKTEPALVLEELGGSPKGGYLAFRGFVPNTSPAPYAAYFSDLRITKAEPANQAIAKLPPLPPGQLTNWRVSPAFDSEPGPITDWPKALPEEKDWQKPIMQANGAFEFLRARQIPPKSRHWSVVAQTTLKSERTQTCAIHLGFSDELTLSLNNQLLSYLDAVYRFDKPRQQGLMHPEQVVIYLPLVKGDNVIQAIVSDRFGGWGLSGRLEDCAGVIEL